MPIAKINIELHYDLDSHYGDYDYSKSTPEDIANDLEDTVYEDLIDLMRGDRLQFWSEIKIEKDEALD